MTIVVDDDLLAQAQALIGLRDHSALIHEALKALVQRQAALRLASLGGSEPDMVIAHRRRPEQA